MSPPRDCPVSCPPSPRVDTGSLSPPSSLSTPAPGLDSSLTGLVPRGPQGADPAHSQVMLSCPHEVTPGPAGPLTPGSPCSPACLCSASFVPVFAAPSLPEAPALAALCQSIWHEISCDEGPPSVAAMAAPRGPWGSVDSVSGVSFLLLPGSPSHLHFADCRVHSWCILAVGRPLRQGLRNLQQWPAWSWNLLMPILGAHDDPGWIPAVCCKRDSWSKPDATLSWAEPSMSRAELPGLKHGAPPSAHWLRPFTGFSPRDPGEGNPMPSLQDWRDVG